MNSETCQTCLSTGRELHPPEFRFNEINEVNAICWECNSIIKKIVKFKAQVRKAQFILSNNKYDLKPLSTLLLTEIQILEMPDTESQAIYKDCDTQNDYQNDDDDDHNELIDSCDAEPKKSYSSQSRRHKSKGKLKIFKSDNSVSNENFNNKSPFNTDVLNLMKVLNKKTLNVKKKFKSIEKIENCTDIQKLPLYDELSKCNNDIDNLENYKFEKIILSREEVLERRERKKNHNNLKKKPYKCELCVSSFSRRDIYEAHVKNTHDEVAKSVGSIKAQCDKHSDDEANNIHCEKCSYVARYPDEMNDHLKEKHQHVCHVCGSEFGKAGGLRKHMSRRHLQEVGHPCKFCDKMFISKTRLESHMFTHDPSLTYCRVCKVKYKNMLTYRQHLKCNVNHLKNFYQCAYCNKRLGSKHYLREHIKFKHLKCSNHKCDSCDKFFLTATSLKEHKQIHHGLERIRKHQCGVCDKKFYTCKALQVHRSVHSELRRYMCEQCGDSFKQRSTLFTHTLRVHKKKLLKSTAI